MACIFSASNWSNEGTGDLSRDWFVKEWLKLWLKRELFKGDFD